MPKVLRLAIAAVSLGLLANVAPADEKKPKGLAEKEIADGWISLFDGETTFGWKVDGEAKVKDGELIVGGEKKATLVTNAAFPEGELLCKSEGSPEAKVVRESERFAIRVPAGQTVRFSQIAFRPSKLEPVFNGKDLAGWKLFKGDPKRELSKFDVTNAGELHVANGPGDLQTEKQFADFALQFECKTNGQGLNSGIFFRCIANEYQNGYEAQIQNSYANGDRTKPIDGGTGAIYRRVPARKVVSNDNEWFAMTVLAKGNHFATWVNGYQTADWTDDRKPDDNPRKGLRTAAGHLSIQGHDKTTDILFRNIRAVEMK